MHKKFDINRANIGSCQSGRKVVPHDSKSYLPLVSYCESQYLYFFPLVIGGVSQSQSVSESVRAVACATLHEFSSGSDI